MMASGEKRWPPGSRPQAGHSSSGRAACAEEGVSGAAGDAGATAPAAARPASPSTRLFEIMASPSFVRVILPAQPREARVILSAVVERQKDARRRKRAEGLMAAQ